jgi:hypothetical protein
MAIGATSVGPTPRTPWIPQTPGDFHEWVRHLPWVVRSARTRTAASPRIKLFAVDWPAASNAAQSSGRSPGLG